MANTQLTMKDRAYLIMHLHAVKYHNFDCMGVLIGQKGGSNEVIVEDSVPLFHQRFQTGTLEVAFDMIESVYLKGEQKIVGIYEAALPGSLTGGREQTPLAQYICEQVYAQFREAVFVQVKPDLNAADDELEVEEQLKGSQGLLFKKFLIN